MPAPFFSSEAILIVEYNPEDMPKDGVAVIAYYDDAAGKWVETAGYVAGGEEVLNTVAQPHSSLYLLRCSCQIASGQLG